MSTADRDPELDALAKAYRVLGALDLAARERVITWLRERLEHDKRAAAAKAAERELGPETPAQVADAFVAGVHRGRADAEGGKKP